MRYGDKAAVTILPLYLGNRLMRLSPFFRLLYMYTSKGQAANIEDKADF